MSFHGVLHLAPEGAWYVRRREERPTLYWGLSSFMFWIAIVSTVALATTVAVFVIVGIFQPALAAEDVPESNSITVAELLQLDAKGPPPMT